MTKASNPKATERLSAQLRANLARRKEQLRKREENPAASELSYRETPVHDPDVHGRKPPQAG